MAPVRMDQLFPPDDVAAQWVFSSSMVVDDLMVLQASMKKWSEDDVVRVMISIHRQMVTRLYEARWLMVAIDRLPEVAAFADIDTEPRILMGLREVYIRNPGEGQSQIEQLYAGLRHMTVHYAWVGERELADVLRQLEPRPSPLPGGIR